MIKNVTIAFFCLLSFVQIQAAEKLLLYHVSRQVQWHHDGKKEPARRGVFLLAKQSLTLTPAAEVMVVQEDGKSILLNKPGTYSFEQLQLLLKKIKAESTSKNFFAYVFEKFINGGDDTEKQRVAAVVYRSKIVMIAPADSSFVFTGPTLQWKPDNTAIPYKIELTVNGVAFDTVLRKQTFLKIPQHLLIHKFGKAQWVQWRCFPADSKQKPTWYTLLIPVKEDSPIIQQQIAILKKTYSAQKEMQMLMERDLLEKWLEKYQLLLKK